MELALRLMGETEVRLNGKRIRNLSAEKAHALLFFLAVENDRAHRREALAEMFWPEKPEGYGRNNLKQTLSQLRTALGDKKSPEPFIISSNRDLQFNSGSSYQVDLLEFEQLSLKVRQHCQSQKSTCEKCAALLDHAVKLYNDDFLIDFSLSDSPEFNEWVVTKRETCKRLMTDILKRLINCCQEKGDYRSGSRYAQQLVDLEPWNESSHRTLMRLLAASGKRSAALKQYQTCEAMLEREFNVKPAPETIKIYERIKDWKNANGEQVLLSVIPGEPSAGIRVTPDERKRITQLKYWVMGSVLISIVVLFWFVSTLWESNNNPVVLDNSTRSETFLPPQIQQDAPEVNDQQAPFILDPKVQQYLQGNYPDQALALIYEKTRGSEWFHNDGWLGDSSPCGWFGITCDQNFITEISLPNNNLVGPLPPEISQLPSLQILDLSNNQISGSIPPEIGNLSSLQYLNLGGNINLEGPIPPEIGSLAKLETLILSTYDEGGSLLSGELPAELGNLKNLDTLLIEQSLIRGPIPAELGNLTQLSSLALMNNQLSGPIPDEIYNLAQLVSLGLGGNQWLEGPISPKISQLTKLDQLDLGHNRLSGNLPGEIGDLVRLRYLSLTSNSFEGYLPLSLTKLNPSTLELKNSGLCVPDNPHYQEWLDTIIDLHSSEINFCSSDEDPNPDIFSPKNLLLPDEACQSGEKLLYLEDFQDARAQGWPEIEYRAQNWEIVVDPDNSDNLILQNPAIQDTFTDLHGPSYGDVVWRVNYLVIGHPEYEFNIKFITDPYPGDLGTITHAHYSLYFYFDEVHFTRETLPFPAADLLITQIDFQSGIWHEIEISTFQGILEVWLDGEKLLVYDDPDPLPDGRIALSIARYQSGGSMVYFDNLRVCELKSRFSSIYGND